MDEKTLHTLEYMKILDRLAGFCAFEASAELARSLRPTNNLFEAQRLQSETREALQLQVLHSDITIGGARDIRASIELANHGGVLTPQELLDVKYTLVSARNLVRTFEKSATLYPNLSAVASAMTPPVGLIEGISRTISDHGEIL